MKKAQVPHVSQIDPSEQEKLIESEKMAAMGGLVAGVSHEINTPLGVNIGNCSLLIELLAEVRRDFDDGKLDANQFDEFLNTAQDLTSSMLKNMQRASKLLSSFKRVAVKNTDEASKLETVDLAELVAEFVQTYHATSNNSIITFNTRIPPNVNVATYPTVILQILAALTSNVIIHAFAPGQKQCEITISVAPAGDGYQLSFTDNGKGVAEDELKKLFEPFYTTKRGAGNAGLGLSIVYNMVKAVLHSDINYESAPGEGFSVSFKLHNIMEESTE